TQTVPKSADSSAAASTGNPEIYHVVSGDTLSTIAAKFYGNSGKWDIIFQANSDRLASPNDLKAGQTLVIPRLNN
ncbi:MAG TPA: LysM peptidoglycan-binding domain-containing protein, partial [Pontiella sp.]